MKLNGALWNLRLIWFLLVLGIILYNIFLIIVIAIDLITFFELNVNVFCEKNIQKLFTKNKICIEELKRMGRKMKDEDVIVVGMRWCCEY